MSKQHNALTGSSSTDSGSFKFPANLIHPPQSQLTRSEDAVANRVVQLDAWAQRLGEGFGISFTTFILNPVLPPGAPSNVDLVTVLRTLVQRDERVSLERKNGKWGLYFTREPAAFTQDRKAETNPLRDAPLDVRERFLTQSEAFFREYLKLCENRLGVMKVSVTSADRTLALLNELQLS